MKEAYFRLAKRFHPDAHHSTALADLRDELEAVFIRLGEAYDVLKDAKKRGAYEERLGRPRPPAAGRATGPAPAPSSTAPPPDPEEEAREAEEALRKATALMEQARTLEQEKPSEPQHQRLTFDAIQLLEPTLRVLQGKKKLRAQLLLARGWSKNPKWGKRAEELLLTVTADSPQSPDAWALLAAIYARNGLKTRAASAYRRVLELEPDHEEALQYLATGSPEAEPAREQGAGGLLGRLFRRG